MAEDRDNQTAMAMNNIKMQILGFQQQVLGV